MNPIKTFVFAASLAGVSLFAAGPAPAPVLVELFTSEGCSSCPPADAVLRDLRDHPGSVPVIAMSEHVDYWNSLGWRDPFSSPEMTQRQQSYAARLSLQGPYTPQMVVDGSDEFVGSGASRARHSIETAAQQHKIPVVAELDGSSLKIGVAPTELRADVMLAVVYDPAISNVSRGENSGRKLGHVSVVRSLRKIGEVSKTMRFDAGIPAPIDGSLTGERFVVIVQQKGQGRVLGVAEVSVRPNSGAVALLTPRK